MRKSKKALHQQVSTWIETQMHERGIDVFVHRDSIHVEGTALVVPVFIRGMLHPATPEERKEFVRTWDGRTITLKDEFDIYEKAVLLQDVEDAWNNQEPQPQPRLWLMPAAR